MNILSSNDSLPSRRIPPLKQLLQFALLLGVSSIGAQHINRDSWNLGGLTILWPTNGLLLAILLCNRKRVWPIYIAIATVIDLSINLNMPDSLPIAAYISACNLLEVLLGAMLLYPIVATNPDLTQPKQLKAFFFYGLMLAPAVASFLASFALDGHFQFPHFLVFDRWFTADLLGAAIVTPLYLSFYKRELFTSRSWLEIVSLFALLAAVSIGIFEQTREPLLFAIMPFLLLLGGRLGLLGSTSGLLMVTVVGTYFTTSSRGPLTLMKGGTLAERDAVLQLFIALSMLLLYVLDVAVYTRNTTERELAKVAMRAGREAEEANRAKTRFLANMSHEIRTPLNGVIGMTELVLGSDLTHDQRECLETVRFSANSLLRILNDILDFSKIEAERIDFEAVEFNLHDCVEEAIKTFAPQAGAKHLELLCEISSEVPELVSGDPGRLRQIILNLVGNAIKFTDHGEVGIAVEVDRQQQNLESIRFTVSDTGVGIPADQQTAIFLPFTQADSSTTRKYGGTGLGLTISARLASIMGGKIWLESIVGRGTKFCFTAQFGILEKQPPAIAPSGNLHGRKILVVDDNASNRQILSNMLRRLKGQVVCVESAEKALEQLALAEAANDPYHILIADTDMPEMDGFQLVEKLSSAPQAASISVIMLLSGSSKNVKHWQPMELQARLSKPVRRKELLAAVHISSGAAKNGITLPKIGEDQGHKTPATGLNILLAEDNRVNQAVAKRLLERRGHTVLIANNGKEAVSILQQGRFDLVLMDIQMPEMDGITATGRIREIQSSTDRHTPIIAMTAHAMKSDRERCLAAGMDGYVTKPINGQELDRAISAALEAPIPG